MRDRHLGVRFWRCLLSAARSSIRAHGAHVVDEYATEQEAFMDWVNDAADWAQLIGIPLTLIAVGIAVTTLRRAERQLDHADKVAQGQFVFALDQVLIAYEDIRSRAAYDPEWDLPPWADEFEGNHARARVRYYLAAFERLGELVHREMIDVTLVAELYGSRLEMLLDKDEVRAIVTTEPEDWRRLVYLWWRLAKHPRRRTLAILWRAALSDRGRFAEFVARAELD
jgi:hypothetical protein